MAASLMTLTGRWKAAAKSNPIQPGPRLTGSVIGCPHRTGPGKLIETASYSQSFVADRTPATICSGVSSGPDGNLRGFAYPEASILTLVPPISTVKTFTET